MEPGLGEGGRELGGEDERVEGGEIRDEQTGSIHGYCRIWTDAWITSPLSLRFAIIPASHKAQQVDDMKVLCEH